MPRTQPMVDIPAALRHLRRTGKPMATLIRRHGPPDFRRTRNSFGSLGRAIIYQQLSGKAATTIYRRFLDLFPGRRFPKPEMLLATPLDRLRGVGVSRGKATYLHDLAQKYADGTVNPRRFPYLDDAAMADVLTQVKGIGQWSVDMFLMFGLLRPDVLPVGDLGVRKGMQAYFGLRELPSPQQMAKHAEPWMPYRSIASWYMWRVIDGETP